MAAIAGIAQVFGSALVLGGLWSLIWVLDADRHDIAAPMLGSLGSALLSSIVAGAFAFRGAKQEIRERFVDDQMRAISNELGIAYTPSGIHALGTHPFGVSGGVH